MAFVLEKCRCQQWTPGNMQEPGQTGVLVTPRRHVWRGHKEELPSFRWRLEEADVSFRVKRCREWAVGLGSPGGLGGPGGSTDEMGAARSINRDGPGPSLAAPRPWTLRLLAPPAQNDTVTQLVGVTQGAGSLGS